MRTRLQSRQDLGEEGHTFLRPHADPLPSPSVFVGNGASAQQACGSGPVTLRPRAEFCSSKSIHTSELGPVPARSRSGPPSHTRGPDLGDGPSLGLRFWAVA